MTTRAPAVLTKCWDEMISGVFTANYEVIHFSRSIHYIRKTIWKGIFQVSHLLTVFSSSANFYIYIAKVAKKCLLSQMCVTCHSRFMYQNIYIFSTDIPVLKAKRLLRQLRLFSWPTMVLIAFPSQVWVFNHVQPLSRNDFVISLPVLKYWRRCPPAVLLWRLTRQSWRRPLSWNQNKNQNVALIISFESWFDNAEFGQNEKNYLELKYVSQFCFPLCFFLGPSKLLMISKNQTKFLEASKMFK